MYKANYHLMWTSTHSSTQLNVYSFNYRRLIFLIWQLIYLNTKYTKKVLYILHISNIQILQWCYNNIQVNYWCCRYNRWDRIISLRSFFQSCPEQGKNHVDITCQCPHISALTVMFSRGFRSRHRHIYPDRHRRPLGCSFHQEWIHICGTSRQRKWL